jgi:MFS family permease
VVLLLGLTSLLTDVSSEMLTAVLPIFLILQLGLTPAQFGLVDGLYRGVSAVSRLAAGLISDRFGRPKLVASIGYGLSTLTRPLLLAAGSVGAVASLISVDRLGKGIRTAPRDAMIAGASARGDLGYNFGVHRAMDNVGAMLGPLVAFGVLLLLPGDFDAVFVVSTGFALLGLLVITVLVPGSRPQRPPRATKPTTTACGAARETGDDCPLWAANLRCRTCGSNARESAAHAESRLTKRDVVELLKSRTYLTRVGVAGLLTVFTVSDAFIFLSLLDRDENLARVFPLFAVGLALVYALLAVPVGRLADRLGRSRVYVVGHVVLLAVYAIVAGPLGTIPAVVATLVLMGLFYAATDGVLAAVVSSVLPDVSRASGLALAQTVVAMSAFVSSVVFGLLLGWTSPAWAYSVMAAGLIVGVFAARRMLVPSRPAAAVT